jgi:hypothetical protein
MEFDWNLYTPTETAIDELPMSIDPMFLSPDYDMSINPSPLAMEFVFPSMGGTLDGSAYKSPTAFEPLEGSKRTERVLRSRGADVKFCKMTRWSLQIIWAFVCFAGVFCVVVGGMFSSESFRR